MYTKVERWGGSLAVKIPDVLATGLGLEEETPVELSVNHGDLVMTPLAHHSLFLDQLLAGITDENLHEEISTGPALGNEAW